MAEQPHHHIVPTSTYFAIFALLMLGTAITVAVAYVDLGVLNTAVALAIACTKATLVVLFFMHVRYSTRLIPVVVFGGVFFLLVMFGITMSDYLSRGFLGAGSAWPRPWAP